MSLNRPVEASAATYSSLLPTFVRGLEERRGDARAILNPSTRADTRRMLIYRWDIRCLALRAEAQRLRTSLRGAAVMVRTHSCVAIDVSAP
jgi:hypothetical protein